MAYRMRARATSALGAISATGARGRDRTADTVIFSHVLYQLSYPGIAAATVCGVMQQTGERLVGRL